MSDKRLTYGINFPPELSQLEIELYCFKTNWPSEKGGLGAYRHYRNALKMIWPNIESHEWMSWGHQSLCEHTVNAWIGCAAAGKTFSAGVFAMMFWACDPLETAVILTSTTGKMVRKRIWPVIQELFHGVKGFPGNLVDSKTTLQAQKGDDKHGIFALAVREGSTSRAVADIQGLHAKRILLIIDEATDTPEAVFEAIANLRKGCIDFRLLVIGNPVSHLDPHGLICTPKDGWGSISVDDEEWETEGVSKWEIEPGICLHFDGTKSPNITAGETKYPYLISARDIEGAERREGGTDSIGYWKYTRGFYAPDGTCKTVMSEAMIEQCDARGSFHFVSKRTKIAGVDPAYGGDRCILRFADIGDLEDGRMGIQLGKRIEIPIKQGKDKHYQIVERVKHECEKEGVPPERLGIDATGEGGGTAEILVREFGQGVHFVEFGGSPSDLPVSVEDPRPANEVYDRKVTELWYVCRRLVQAGLLKGMLDKEIIEFTHREFTDEKRKIVLDRKDECRSKIGRSPDDADAVAVVVDVARRLGVVANGVSAVKANKRWLAKALEMSEIYVPEEKESHPTSYFFDELL
jgi:hypothetical protein